MLGDTDALATAATSSPFDWNLPFTAHLAIFFVFFFKFSYLICVQLVPIQLLIGLGEGKGAS